MRLPETAASASYGLAYGIAAGGLAQMAMLDLGLPDGHPIARQAVELFFGGMQQVTDSLVHLGTATSMAELMAGGICAIAPVAAGGVIGWAAGKGVQAIFKVPAMAKMRTHLGHLFDRHTNSIERKWAEKNRDVLKGVVSAKGDFAKDGKEHFFWIDDQAQLHEVSQRQYLMFARVLRHGSDVQIEIEPSKLREIRRDASGKLQAVGVRPRLEVALKPGLSQTEVASILTKARAELTTVVKDDSPIIYALNTRQRLDAWRQHRDAEKVVTATAAEITEAFDDEDDDAPSM